MQLNTAHIYPYPQEKGIVCPQNADFSEAEEKIRLHFIVSGPFDEIAHQVVLVEMNNRITAYDFVVNRENHPINRRTGTGFVETWLRERKKGKGAHQRFYCPDGLSEGILRKAVVDSVYHSEPLALRSSNLGGYWVEINGSQCKKVMEVFRQYQSNPGSFNAANRNCTSLGRDILLKLTGERLAFSPWLFNNLALRTNKKIIKCFEKKGFIVQSYWHPDVKWYHRSNIFQFLKTALIYDKYNPKHFKQKPDNLVLVFLAVIPFIERLGNTLAEMFSVYWWAKKGARPGEYRRNAFLQGLVDRAVLILGTILMVALSFSHLDNISYRVSLVVALFIGIIAKEQFVLEQLVAMPRDVERGSPVYGVARKRVIPFISRGPICDFMVRKLAFFGLLNLYGVIALSLIHFISISLGGVGFGSWREVFSLVVNVNAQAGLFGVVWLYIRNPIVKGQAQLLMTFFLFKFNSYDVSPSVVTMLTVIGLVEFLSDGFVCKRILCAERGICREEYGFGCFMQMNELSIVTKDRY